MAHGQRRDRIRNEHAAQVRCVGDEIFHYVKDSCRLAVGYFIGSNIQCPIFRSDHLLEALSALLERSNSRHGGDHRNIAFSVSIGPRDCHSESVCGDATHIQIIGRQERGHGLGIGGGLDADDLDLLGGFIDRLSERGKLRGRDDDRRGI